MVPSPEWFDSKTGATLDAVKAGDGCHPDEARALSDYLSGSISTDETATRITASLLQESNPQEELYRLWSLLCEAMVELSDNDRHKTLDLLSQIQSLPPASAISWAKLPGFGSMWDSLYRLHLHGNDSWEYEVGSFDEQKVYGFRRDYAAIGCAEAEMYLRGMVPGNWGYQVLNLACSDRPGFDILVSEIFAWLDTAGWKLKEEMNGSEKTAQRYKRPIPNSTRHEQQAVEATLAEHWASWKESLLRLSQEGSGQSEAGRRIAGQCCELM